MLLCQVLIRSTLPFRSNKLNRDQGVNAIESLMEKRGAFDYVLLETTGLADPGNIAPLFWVDEGLGSTIYLDGIVTVVDAKNVLRNLDEPPPETVKVHDGHAYTGPALTTAHLQISHADVVVLNKSDLVNPVELTQVQQRIRAINGLAKIFITSHSMVPYLEGVLLDLHGYDSVSADELEFASKGHSHLDPTISTTAVSLPVLSDVQLEKLDSGLRKVLWESELPLSSLKTAFEVHRVKGRVLLQNGKVKLVQGVREVFEIFDSADSSSTSQLAVHSEGKLVLIGRGISHEEFKKCLFLSLEIV
jgi:G3E family GTPase